ncbi:MAG: hypothetical protein JKY44_04180 [Flavobacteriaceae bacterium]|nr:hypothetical protein [Flavobacteriaceae bacterium]
MLEVQDNNFTLRYLKEDKITDTFTHKNLEDLKKVYSIYSTDSIAVLEEEDQRVISIPTLNIKE